MADTKPIRADDEYSYTLHTNGSASPLPGCDDDEVIKRLHQAVKDVTGKDVTKPVKPRIGFLP